MRGATYYSTNDHDTVYDILPEFDVLIQKAKDSISSGIIDSNKCIIVIETKEQQVYCAPDEEELINTICKTGNNKVVRLVCMWQDNSLDMPSYNFREMLCKINAENAEAKMILSGVNCYILKTIKETMGKKFTI